MVLVELEEVAPRAGGQHLTTGGEVPHRGQQAVGVPGDPQEAVVQPTVADAHRIGSGRALGRAATVDHPHAGAATTARRAVGQFGHLGPLVGRRIERHQAVSPAVSGQQGSLGLGDDRAGRCRAPRPMLRRVSS